MDTSYNNPNYRPSIYSRDLYPDSSMNLSPSSSSSNLGAIVVACIALIISVTGFILIVLVITKPSLFYKLYNILPDNGGENPNIPTTSSMKSSNKAIKTTTNNKYTQTSRIGRNRFSQKNNNQRNTHNNADNMSNTQINSTQIEEVTTKTISPTQYNAVSKTVSWPYEDGVKDVCDTADGTMVLVNNRNIHLLDDNKNIISQYNPDTAIDKFCRFGNYLYGWNNAGFYRWNSGCWNDYTIPCYELYEKGGYVSYACPTTDYNYLWVQTQNNCYLLDTNWNVIYKEPYIKGTKRIYGQSPKHYTVIDTLTNKAIILAQNNDPVVLDDVYGGTWNKNKFVPQTNKQKQPFVVGSSVHLMKIN